MGLGGVPPVFADEVDDEEAGARARPRLAPRASSGASTRIDGTTGIDAERSAGPSATAAGPASGSLFRASFARRPVWPLCFRHGSFSQAGPHRRRAPKPPTAAEAAAARQRARERAGEDEHPRKSGPARGGKG